MELNAQLVNVAGHFRPLRFIFLQFSLQIGEFLRRCRAGGHRHDRDRRRFATALAIQRHSGGGCVNNERTGAMLTLENEVAMFAFCLGTNRVHHSIIKQRLYQRREHTLLPLRRRQAEGGLWPADILEVFRPLPEFGDELTQRADPSSAIWVILALFRRRQYCRS
jgi:hypothetical protein